MEVMTVIFNFGWSVIGSATGLVKEARGREKSLTNKKGKQEEKILLLLIRRLKRLWPYRRKSNICVRRMLSKKKLDTLIQQEKRPKLKTVGKSISHTEFITEGSKDGPKYILLLSKKIQSNG